MRNRSIVFMLLLVLLLCACSGKDNYEPFRPLSKETASPAREAAVQAALNGEIAAPTKKPQPAPTQTPADIPTFDENSFFAEVDPDPAAPKTFPTEASPFAAEPTVVTPTKPVPTATPAPTATKPYDPNIMMYGVLENGMRTYTLQEGEDLICIARRFDISLQQLLAQNRLAAPSDAKTGDVLYLPRNPSGWSRLDGYGGRILVLHPAVYVTNPGDNLFSIACSFGDVRPEDIAVKNKLVLGEPLQAGIEITIP